MDVYRQQFGEGGQESLYDVKYPFPECKHEQRFPLLTEEFSHGLVFPESLCQGEHHVSHHTQGAVSDLRVKVLSLVASKPEVLAAFLDHHLYVPAYLVEFKDLDELHVRVSCQYDIPCRVPSHFHEYELHVDVIHHCSLLEIQALVSAARDGLPLVQADQLVDVELPLADRELVIAHPHTSDHVYGSFSYLPYLRNHLGRDEPRAYEGVWKSYPLLPRPGNHFHGSVALLGIQFLVALTAGGSLSAVLVELQLSLPATQAVVPLRPLLTVQ